MKNKDKLVAASLLSLLIGCDSGKNVAGGNSSPVGFVDSAVSNNASVSSDAVTSSSSELYKKLIAQEKAQRIAEDEKLQVQIEELSKKVADLELKLTSELAKLQAKDIELSQQIAQLESSFNLNLTDLKEALKKKADISYVDELIVQVRKEIAESTEQAKKELISDYQAKITELKENSATKAEMETALASLKEEIARAERAAMDAVDGLRTEIFTRLQDYASKSELSDLKAQSEQARLALEGRVLSTIADNMKQVWSKFSDVENDMKKKINEIRNDTNKNIETKYQEFLALKSLLMSDDVDTSSFKDLGGLLGFLNSIQGDLQSDLSQQIAKVDKLSRRIAQNADAIAANKKRIVSLKEKQDSLFKRMNLNEEQIAKVNDKVDQLRGDFNSFLEQIGQLARSASSVYSPEIQEQFAKLATDIASIKAAENNQRKELYLELSDKYGLGSVDSIAKSLDPLFDSVVGSASKALRELASLQIRLGDNLGNPSNPFNELLDSTVDMAACKGNTSYTFHTVLDMDSLQYLIQSYNQGFFYESNRDLFYGISSALSDSDYLSQKIVAQMVQTSFSIEDTSVPSNCLMQVKSYQEAVLKNIQSPSGVAGDSLIKRYTSIRSSLLSDTAIKRQLTIYQSAINEIISSSQKLEVKIVEFVKKGDLYLTSSESVRKEIERQIYEMISSESNGTTPSLLSQISSTIMNISVLDSIRISKERKLNDYVEEIKELATKMSKDALIVNLEKLFDSYSNMSTELNAKVDDLSNDLTGTQESLKKVINVLSAHLLSSTDVPKEWFEILEEANGDLGGEPIDPTGLRPVISNAQHFFSADKYTSQFCDPNFISLDGGVRTALMHGAWNQCWVNYRSLTSDKIKTTSSNIIYRLFGTLKTVNMKVKDAVSGNVYYEKNYDFASADSKLVKHGSFVNSVFDIKDGESLKNYISKDCYLQAKSSAVTADCVKGWSGVKIDFTPSLVDGSSGSVYQYQIQLYSPLVLDFTSVGTMQSTPVAGSQIKFDLDADGKAENTGWVRGQEGAFLARDLNHNGKIDSGSELFGQSSLCGTEKSVNGFEALKCLDSNKDGKVDSLDTEFKSLLVWFDNNNDGVSDASELKTLDQVGVQYISVNYDVNMTAERFISGNDHRFVAKFQAKGCPEQGCNVYDVFFNSSSSLTEK